MPELNLFTGAFLVVAIIGVIHGIWKAYFRRCTACDGYYRLYEMKDSMGTNITKKIIITAYKGPRKGTYIYRCNKCEHEIIEEKWEWS